MSLAGERNILGRKLDKLDAESRRGNFGGKTNQGSEKGYKHGILINAINDSGADLDAFSCVKIIDPSIVGHIPTIDYPATDDEDEDVMYGSLIEDSNDGKLALVQISGEALFLINNGSELIKVGQKIYPLGGSYVGLVGNKAGNSADKIGNGIGRSLTKEGSDTNIVRVNLNLSGGAENNILATCRVATTANHGLSGLSNVDGKTISADDYVLVWKQSTASQNGVYTASSTAWTKVVDFDSSKLYKLISVAVGTLYGPAWFVVTAANTVEGMGAFYK